MPAYIEQSEAAHFAWWCEQNLRHSVDRFARQPVIWEPWQMDWWTELLAWDDDRNAPYWRSAALIVARKNGKTQMLAALALYRLLTADGMPEILLAAASDKQAGRLFESCIAYLRMNPELNRQLRRREHYGEIVNPRTGGKIIKLASTGESLDGYNPSLVIADELHAWTTPTRRRVWTSMRTAAGARENFQIVTITTAGDAASRASSILGVMLDGNEKSGEIEKPHDGLTISRNHDSRLMIHNYSAPTTNPGDWEKMKLANPASWITAEFIDEQAKADDLSDADVLQLHGCVWAETNTTYVSQDAIRRAMDGYTDVQPGESVVLSFDGSERNDETWLTVTTLDGRIMPVGQWAKPPKSDADWRVPREEVHMQVDSAFTTYNVVEFAVDPPGWYSEIDLWRETYGAELVVEFDTNKPVRFAPACERLRAGFNDGTATFGGALGGNLREHLGNCVTRETPSGLVVQKDDKNSPRKIDGAVTAIIGFDRATWHAGQVVEEYTAVGF